LSTLYKVVETQIVTDEVLEDLINCWTARGWMLDGIKFAMTDASKRPSMAFILFTRVGEALEEEDGNPRECG
jgi:hypothetical protein